MSDYTAAKNEIIKKRGYRCEVCDSTDNLQLNHFLFGRRVIKGKRMKELDDERNFRVECARCHMEKRRATHEDKVDFWRLQCQRYGRENMIQWLQSIPIKAREKYENY